MTFMYPNKPRRIYQVPRWAQAVDLAKWLVQPKWNGHRTLPYVDASGRATIYSRYGAPLQLARDDFAWLGMVDLPRPFGLDGELLFDGRMIVWDFYMLGGRVTIKDAYAKRLRELRRALPRRVNKGKFSLEAIETLPATKYRNYMMRKGEAGMEGFVFKHRDAADLWGPYSTSDVSSMFKYRF